MWLGKENVRENERHAKRVVDWLAEGLERRLARDARGEITCSNGSDDERVQAQSC